MDPKMTQKNEKIFKDKSAAFNHLIMNAPVGSLSNILSKIKVFYNFEADINKVFESILNYHLSHLTTIPYKNQFILLSSANLVRPKFLPVKPTSQIGQGLPAKGQSIADFFNPLKDKSYTLKKELAGNLLERFHNTAKSSSR